MNSTAALQKFVFGELSPDTGGRGPAGASLAGLSEHQLRKLIGELQSELDHSNAEKRVLIEQAREDGFRLGLESAREELEASVLAATDCVNDALETISETIAGKFDAVVRDSAGLALVVAEHLAGQMIEASPCRIVEGALATVLADMHKLTELELEVHPSLVEPLRNSIGSNKKTNRRLKVSIHADERLLPGDAQISWGDGGLKVDAATRRAAILEALCVILPEDVIAA